MIRFFVATCVALYAITLQSQETYIDRFNEVSYTNNDGTASWSSNWIEEEEFAPNNDPDTGDIYVFDGQLVFRQIWQESIARSANLAGATSAVLWFDWATIGLEVNEELSVQVSADGVNFVTLANFSFTQSSTHIQDISPYISANTTIRFINTKINWSSPDDLMVIDNVRIEAIFPNRPPVLTVRGDQQFCGALRTGVPIVESVAISDPDSADTTLNQVLIQITSGYENGKDLLQLTGIHPTITTTWDVTQGSLLLSGPATFAAFETALRSIRFSSPATMAINTKEFSIVLGNALFLPETGHYYEFVPAAGIRWDTARDAAAARTFFGLQGYLTTLTSEVEATFAGSQITGNGWIGASDNQFEGFWQWVTGPEAGLAFWFGDEGGRPILGRFSFWNTGEPNDYPNDFVRGEENYAHITAPGIGIDNSWNDLPIGGGEGDFAAQGYIVEYGGMPGDPDLATISGVTKLQKQCTVITNRRQTYRVKK